MSLDKNTLDIIKACKLVIQAYEDYESEVMTVPVTVIGAIEQLWQRLKSLAKQNTKQESLAE